MGRPFPYAYVNCPCTSQTEAQGVSAISRRASYISQTDQDHDQEDDKPLNPHDPRTNYSIYPYDQLLYCDECQQIKCPKCWTEEITNWYCPSCLFEVPSSLVRADGNRCSRNCYNCPLCTSPLSITALDSQPKDHSSAADAAQPGGPFILTCSYCEWSSLEIGIEFSKPTKITEQLVRHRKRTANGEPKPSSDSGETLPRSEASQLQSHDALFANLTKFYKTQLKDSDTASSNAFGDNGYGSPGNLTRIMQLYGGLSATALKKSRERPQPMREALNQEEGLILTTADQDSVVIDRLRMSTHSSTTTPSQRLSHPWNNSVRFRSDLWPVPTLLRTRLTKRCSTCRHILARLDDRKTTSTSTSSGVGSSMKYKIRLLAQNNIPRLSLRLFAPGVSASSANPSPAFALTPAALKAASDTKDWDLAPGRTVQFLLTLTNPLFESVKVTLATPTITPGRVQSKVTILCPAFDIGADGDMWDEALSSTTGAGSSRSRVPSAKDGVSTEDRQPEAGKVWERGRNWTSVVVEVVPGSVAQTGAFGMGGLSLGAKETDVLVKDGDDILEIPVLVRVEWEAEVAAEEGGVVAPGTKAPKESRELAFWTVLGAGRILPW